LKESLDDVIRRSKEAGVEAWIQGGVSPEDWERQSLLKKQYGRQFLTAFGLHPWWVSAHSESENEKGFALLEKKLPEADALGELGLDLGERHEKKKDLQVRFFEKQLELSKTIQKPLVLHLVRSHGEAIQILKKKGPYPKRGIVHSFSGSLDVAKEYIKMGFLLSLCGSVTKTGYHDLKKAVVDLPLEHLVIETDAPDQKPSLEGLDGLNEPKNLIGIAKTVADLRGVSYEEVLEQSLVNLKKVFNV
jgi:TatD DNase family protein